MKKINNLDDVLFQIESLRDSLSFSSELFPIMKDLFIFLKDMIPLLIEANISIKESTSRLPTASDNIDNVSKMTETSTNQVLDTIESINDKLNNLSKMIVDKKDQKSQLDLVDEISEMSSNMIFAFQFQDITTQKLEHTNRILKTVHDKFLILFKSFEKMRSNSAIGNDVAKAIEHEFEKEQNKEAESKKFFDEGTKDIIHQNAEFSQDDIDNFFK